jgi:zinc carboxypeptidase
MVFATVGLALLGFQGASAIGLDKDGWPVSRAERTNYAETSHYDDVIAFIEALQRKGAPISVEYIGTSKAGHRMPLVIAARPMVASPAEARRTGKPIIYIQGNIHAGEVEGKEAALAILRRACQEGPGGLLDKAIILCDPIYNIDGNEMFGPQDVNRPEQNGPELVGHRESGEGFDLNRDGIKAESFEFRAVLSQIWNTWDPDVMLDLHTTDGTRHGYDLTYAPPLNPNTPSEIVKFSRDEMLPSIRRDLRQRFGLELFDYGDAVRRNNETVWSTFEEGGRYMTNYAGLRNRIGILSEATTYISFRDRVVATDRFVTAVLDYVLKNSRRVLDITRKTDELVSAWGLGAEKAAELGVQFKMAPRGTEETILEAKPAPGQPRPTGRPTKLTRVKMPIYERFVPTKTAKAPTVYVIPESEPTLVALLRRHGIVVERLKETCTFDGSRFTISEAKVAARPFQKHRLIQLAGTFSDVNAFAPAGGYLVRMNQPLGALIFNILEPESSDGAATWGFLSESPSAGSAYPVLKCFKPIAAVTERVP